jgi:hypothetical protein
MTPKQTKASAHRALVARVDEAVRPMQRRMFALWSSYSERELGVVLDFLSRSSEIAVEWTRELQGR